MTSGEVDIHYPIMDMAYLQKLLEKGYVIEGPRHKLKKDLLVFKKILRRGYDFIPEDWLANKGYVFVEQSHLTKGFKLAYIIENNVLLQYFKSNYSLCKNHRKICLYLRASA